MVGSLPDIIMCRNFHVEIFRDYDFTGGLISHLPLIFAWALLHCSATCAACDNSLIFLSVLCGGRDSWPLSVEVHSFIAEIGRTATLCKPIRGKLHSCPNGFLWQFSISMQCALPTRSQFSSPYRNHTGHTIPH